MRRLAAIGLVTACVGGRSPAPGYSYPPARLELRIAPQVPIKPPRIDPVVGRIADAGASDEVDAQCEIRLTNIYDRPLWVNGRLGITAPQPPGYGELVVKIEGSSGKIPFECHDYAIAAKSKNYSILKPGDSLTQTCSLECYSGFNVGETYTAIARYHDRNPNAPVSPPSAIHLATEIVSKPVQFAVVP